MKTKYISALILSTALFFGCQDKSANTPESVEPQQVSSKEIPEISLDEAPVMPSLEPAKIGDPAKDLHISEWVKGDAVSVTDKQNIYVVEFWATWCGPCKASIPHLTELRKKYADKQVFFVGVSSEDADTVKPFVKEMGDSMDYHVAVDKGNKTYEDYMLAFGEEGIPTAFVINKDGKIVWHGHPMDGLESTLDSILDGSFNLQKLIDEKNLEAEMDRLAFLMVNNDSEAETLSEELLKKAIGNKDGLTYLLGVAYTAMNEAYFNKILDELAKLPEMDEIFVTSRKLTFYTRLYGKSLLENDDDAAQRISKTLLECADKSDASSLITASYLLANLVKTEENCATALSLLDLADKKLEKDADSVPTDYIRGIMKIRIGKNEEGNTLINKGLEQVKDPEVKEFLQAMVKEITSEESDSPEPIE